MNRRKQIESRKNKNYCCAFILPMCNINYRILPQNFINGYINDNYVISLVFDKTEDYDINFYNFSKSVAEHNPHFINSVEEEDEVVINLQIPEKHYENYNLFLEGSYSKFDNNFKKVLVNYFGNKSIQDSYKASVYNAIHPQEFKIKQIAERLYEPKDIKQGIKNIKEVLERPNLEREYFKSIQQLIEQSNNQQNIQYECKQ